MLRGLGVEGVKYPIGRPRLLCGDGDELSLALALTAPESLDRGGLLFVLLISKLQLYFVEGGGRGEEGRGRRGET